MGLLAHSNRAPARRRPGLFGRLPCIATIAVILTALTSAATQAQTLFRGKATYQDGSPCHFRNPLFGRSVNTTATLYDNNGALVTGSPKLANALGEFAFTLDTGVRPSRLELSCAVEGTRVGALTRTFTFDDSADTREPITLALPNRRPVITQLAASVAGRKVSAVQPGTTVVVRATASDPDGQPLLYQWFATAGVVISSSGPTVSWTLPNSGGLHFIYVLVSDRNAGFRQKQLALSSDPNPLVFESESPGAQPSDKLPSDAHFLAIQSLGRNAGKDAIDDRYSACLYYRSINAVGECDARGNPIAGPGLIAAVDFAKWKKNWGFDVDGGTTATYANLVDLNLQRDMHGKLRLDGFRPSGPTSVTGSRSGKDAAFYVCNYPNPAADTTLQNVTQQKNLVACVAMEYSVELDRDNFGKAEAASWWHNDGRPIMKFYTFGPDGKLLLSVNLDGRGEKFVPGTCVVCHGGSTYPGKFGVPNRNPNFGSQFLPFDLASFKTPRGDIGGFTPSEEFRFYQLNQIILGIESSGDSTTPTAAIKELVNGWYQAPGTPRSQYRGFVPAGWFSSESFYTNLFRPTCRSCHVAAKPVLAQSSEAFNVFGNVVGDYACGSRWGSYRKYSMPNAKATSDHLWAPAVPGPLPEPKSDELMRLLSSLPGVTDDFGRQLTTCEPQP